MTDAVQAGQKPATIIQNLVSNLWFPALMYFYIIPTFFKAKKEPTDVEIAEPATWLWTITKCFLMAAALFIGFLVLIYVKQEGMLFVPSQPIQDFDQNPDRYKNPAQRNLHFTDINLKTSDNLKLHGWLMTSGSTNFRGKDTVVFMHENAGNIGLRLDYFESLCNYAQVNVLSIAYRGYSKSEGAPTELGLELDAAAIGEFLKT